MANARMRALVMGRPKAGKTSLLAELANAGFKIGLLDFDNNPDPLFVYTKPEFRENLSVVTLQDNIGLENGRFTLKDEPTSILRLGRALDDWGRVDKDRPWGPVRTWGPDMVLALDSLTGLGDAIFNFTCFVNNRRGLTQIPDWVWHASMREEDNWVRRLMSNQFNCHVLLTAHVKAIGPKVERIEKDDDDDLKTAKAEISRKNAELIETRYYPTALGKALPQEITRRVPSAFLVEADGEQRKIWLKAPPHMPIDIGAPGVDKRQLPHPAGILDIMEAACGYRKAPVVEKEAA